MAYTPRQPHRPRSTWPPRVLTKGKSEAGPGEHGKTRPLVHRQPLRRWLPVLSRGAEHLFGFSGYIKGPEPPIRDPGLWDRASVPYEGLEVHLLLRLGREVPVLLRREQ